MPPKRSSASPARREEAVAVKATTMTTTKKIVRKIIKKRAVLRRGIADDDDDDSEGASSSSKERSEDDNIDDRDDVYDCDTNARGVKTNTAPVEEAENCNDKSVVLRHLANMRSVIGVGVAHLGVGGGASSDSSLLCREHQVSMILRFLESTDGHPALQLFGMPGTGKTAAVKNALARFASLKQAQEHEEQQRRREEHHQQQRSTRGVRGGSKKAAVDAEKDLDRTFDSGGSKQDVVSVIYFNGYVMQRPTDVFAALLRHLTRYRLSGGNTSGGAGRGSEKASKSNGSSRNATKKGNSTAKSSRQSSSASTASSPSRVAPHHAAAALEKRFATGWGPHIKRFEDIPLCVIVIDEMDKCCEQNGGKTLFRLVDWLTMPYAKLKMITIANAMQLPERLDAKTRSRLNTTQRVTFPSYAPEELQHILAQRLDAAHNQPSVRSIPCRIMSAAAGQYICRQIGLHNGDVRRLLQTSAAALQDVLVVIDDFAEKVKAATNLTLKEAEMALSVVGLPTAAEAVDGVAQVRHLSAVARNVLHDRFQDFLNALEAPFMYTVILLIASESIKQAALQRSELATSQLPLDRLFLLVRATVEAYVKMDDEGGNTNGASTRPPPPISLTQFLTCLEALRQVNFIELSVSDSDATLRDAKTATSISAPVSVTIVHPPHDIIARCEGHKLFEQIGKQIIKRHQS